MTSAVPANPSFAMARLFLDEAYRNGVTAVIIAPGSRSTALALAFDADPRFHVYTQLDERSAGFFALGYARVTGRVLPVVVTSGSAVAQLHPAVIEADASGVPLLVVSADRPVELRDTGANQTIRQANLFGDATRMAVTLEVLDDHPRTDRFVRSVVQQALSAAHGGATRPGPVQLNVAFREPTVPTADDGRSAVTAPWEQPLPGRDNAAPWAPVVAPVRTPDPAFMVALATRLAGRQGVIVGGVIDTDASDGALVEAVDRLAGRLGWPVLAEAASDLRHCQTAVAHVAHIVADDSFAARHRPDVVLRFGRTGTTAGLDQYLRPAGIDVLVDPYGSVFDPDRHVTDRVIADPLPFVQALEKRLETQKIGASAALARAFDTAETALVDLFDTELSQSPDTVLSEPATLRLLAQTDVTDLLVVGSSMPIRDLDSYGPKTWPVDVLANRGASGIDGFLSVLLGATAARRKFTVGVCGDVTFLHDINGLLATGCDVPAAVVVLDNNGGAIFSFLPQAAYPDALERVFAMPHGRDITAIATAHGANAVTATTVGALNDALVHAQTTPGITVIRVPSDRHENVALHQDLRAQARTVLADLDG